jgi:hypothetical protein
VNVPPGRLRKLRMAADHRCPATIRAQAGGIRAEQALWVLSCWIPRDSTGCSIWCSPMTRASRGTLRCWRRWSAFAGPVDSGFWMDNHSGWAEIGPVRPRASHGRSAALPQPVDVTSLLARRARIFDRYARSGYPSLEEDHSGGQFGGQNAASAGCPGPVSASGSQCQCWSGPVWRLQRLPGGPW